MNAQNDLNQINGLQLWLRADSNIILNGNNISQWIDCSQNNYNIFQNNSDYQPVFIDSLSEINNKPVIRFDGNDFLDGGNILNINTSSVTIYLVGKCTVSSGTFIAKSLWGSSSGRYAIWYNSNSLSFLYQDDNNRSISTSKSPSGYELINAVNDRANSLNQINSNNQVLGTALINPIFDMTSTNNFLVGAYNNSSGGVPPIAGNFLIGDIAEILVFDKMLSESEIGFVEGYLRNKYAPPVDLGSDVAITYGFCDTLIDAGDRFLSYEWNTGEMTQTFNISTSGNYSVTVTDIFGFTSSDTINVHFPQVTLQDTVLCPSDSILLSTGLTGMYTYLWSGGYTTPSIYVTSAGNYNVTVTDLFLCNFVTSSITVSIDSFPILASLGPDISLCAGNSIGLITPNSIPNNINYYWSTAQTTSNLVVSSSGTYSITATDSNNCRFIDSISVDVLGVAPLCDFSYLAGCSGSITQFTNLSTPLGSSCLWDFGDGQVSVTENPTHSFINGGIYNVKLTVSDGSCSNTLTKQINIYSSPQAFFNTSTACINNSYLFIDQSNSSEGNITNWEWIFGDESAHSTDTNPTHTYSMPGVYNVELTIQTDSGCQASIFKPITVVDSYITPSTFTLFQPHCDLVTIDTIINFAWNTAQNAISYTLEYSTDSLFSSNVVSISQLVNPSISQSFLSNQTFYWRVIAYNVCGDSVISERNKITVFSSNTINGLKLWLRADSNVVLSGNKVSQWLDCSGNSNSVFQTNSNSQPILEDSLSLINNYPAMRFDGNDDYLDGGNILNINNGSLTIYIVGRCFSPNGTYIAKSLWGDAVSRYAIWYNANNLSFLYQDDLFRNLSTIKNPSGFELVNAINDRMGSLNKLYSNSQQLGVVSINPIYSMLSTYNFLVGAYNNSTGEVPPISGRFLNGDIAEILMFDTVLTQTNKNIITSYISDKYAPPVNLGADIYTKLFCPISLEAGDRFNDFYWSTGSTDSAISVNTSGTYWVRVTDIFGRVSSDTVEVHFPEVLKDTLFCANDSVTINPDYTGLYSYLWSNSDTTWQTTITHGGAFWLEVTDTAMCVRRDSFIVTVDSIRYHASLGPDTTLCSGNPLSLQSGGDEAVSYSWWPGGQTAPEITVYNTGLYVLTVLSENGCEAKDSVDVYIQGVAPIPGFSTQNLCFGDTIVFTDTSLSLDLSNVVSWVWTFPDATQMTGPVAEKVLGAAGMYPVVLTVTTDSSCSSTMTKQVQVFPLPEPQFVWTNPCTGLPLVFTNQSTISLGQVVDYFWILDNTDTSYIENPTFYPETETEISVYMQATSNMGCWQDTSLSIYIKKSPVALFDISPSCSEKVTYFFDLSEATIIHPIMQWNWSLGIAGVTTQQQNPNYTYLSPGIYPVSLQVRSLNGCTDTYLKSVSVSANPIAGFSGMEVCEGLPLIISDTSTTVNGTIIQRTWEVDAMGAYSDSSISVVFPDSGDYAVELFVTSELYCTDSVRKIVRVHPLPMADFIMDKDFGPVPLLVQFVNESSSGSYLWAFGDGHSSTLTNPQHLYLNKGEYTVQIEVTDSNGCRQTGSNSVSVVSDLYDLVLFGMDTIIEGDIKKVVLYIANSGSLPVTNPLVLISAGQTMLYSETMNQTLQPGQIYSYTMASGTYLPNDNSGAYVCAKILLPQGQIDVNMTNNEFCLARENGLLLLRVFPNPVSEELVIEFSSEKEMKGALQITNTTGKRVLNAEINMSKGFNRLLLNVSNYDQGMYFLNLSDQNSNIFYKFAKN